MKRTGRFATAGTLILSCLIPLCAATSAPAEVARRGNTIATFSGGISPRKLPRRGKAPVTVRLGGRIHTTDRSEPPVLERIVLEINREGVVQTRGLGRCPLHKLKTASSEGAKRSCKDALVGHGSVTSRVTLPDQGAFASNGKLLAFNGRFKHKQAVLAQVSSGAPLPLTYVIVFQVRRSKGTFGTSLVGKLPPIASSYGYISAFHLNLRRVYRFHRKRRSFASAGCPAPKGFGAASFPFARATYAFEDGKKLKSTLIRQCRVRGR